MLDKRLEKLLHCKKIPHLLIFHGPSTLKKQMAELFCQKVLKEKIESHPDMHIYFPEGKQGLHSTSSMRELCDEITLTSYRGGMKCFLVEHADRMLPSSAQSLLKTFEEPSKKTLIILLTTALGKILPTILSRAQSFYFAPTEIVKDPIKDKVVSILVQKSPLQEIYALTTTLEKIKDAPLQQDLEDLSTKQKERVRQEHLGQSVVAFQNQLQEVFVGILEFARDLCFTKQSCEFKLFYPEHQKEYEKFDHISVDEVQQLLDQAKIAIDRGMKLSFVFDVLFTKIRSLYLSFH